MDLAHLAHSQHRLLSSGTYPHSQYRVRSPVPRTHYTVKIKRWLLAAILAHRAHWNDVDVFTLSDSGTHSLQIGNRTLGQKIKRWLLAAILPVGVG